jgi:hypothetical protein
MVHEVVIVCQAGRAFVVRMQSTDFPIFDDGPFVGSFRCEGGFRNRTMYLATVGSVISMPSFNNSP